LPPPPPPPPHVTCRRYVDEFAYEVSRWSLCSSVAFDTASALWLHGKSASSFREYLDFRLGVLLRDASSGIRLSGSQTSRGPTRINFLYRDRLSERDPTAAEIGSADFFEVYRQIKSISGTRRERHGGFIVKLYKLRVFPSDSDPHLDNRVHPMHAPFATKHERLAAECSRPEAQADCLPGQKWRCERDGHRWRRYKCRYAIPPPPQRVSKKCACFTPSGVIYTRLDSDDYDGQRYSFARDRRFDPYGEAVGYFIRRGKYEFISLLRLIAERKIACEAHQRTISNY